MKNSKNTLIRNILQGYFVGVVVLLVVLLLVSWLLSIYVDGVEGLLTARGIRWLCSSIVENFASVPLAEILLGMMTVSVLKESGVGLVLKGHTSLKQRRALQVTGVALLVVLCIFSLLLFLPQAVLLSAFGTVSHSAFSKGFFGLLTCVLIFLGNVYGYTSGRFTSLHDFFHAHVSLFASMAGYFVILFFASQLVGCLHYTGILSFLGDNDTLSTLLADVLYAFPLLLYLALACRG